MAGPVVLFVGNPLLGDEGFGLAVLEALPRFWETPPEVELVDGGTWGMNLLPTIEDADPLVLVDAIDAGQPAGTPLTLERAELPRYLATKLSPHQIDLREVLALADLRGHLAERTVAIGIQPARIATGVGLTPVMASRVEQVAAAVALRLEIWGYPCRRLAVPAAHA
jgi:hydrogenase maturation protease